MRALQSFAALEGHAAVDGLQKGGCVVREGTAQLDDRVNPVIVQGNAARRGRGGGLPRDNRIKRRGDGIQIAVLALRQSRGVEFRRRISVRRHRNGRNLAAVRAHVFSCSAKVDQDQPPLVVDQEVLGFDVPMQHVGFVHGPHGFQQLFRKIDDARGRQVPRVFGNDGPEVSALDVIHHHVRRAVFFENGADSDNIAMLERRDGAAFLQEQFREFPEKR